LTSIFTFSIDYILDSSILHCQPSDNITNDLEIKNNAINVNSPNVNFTISEQTIQKVTTTLTTATGVTAGVKLAQQVPSLGGKALAVAGTAFFSQALNTGTTKILKSMKDDTDTKLNLINEFNTGTNKNINLDDYPLNLLFELDQLINVEIIFMVIILNVFITNILINNSSKIDNYIPKNLFGKVLDFIIQRFIKIWGSSSNFLLIFS
jgi:hypothetical protein